jgi:hypothetical protein
MFSTSNEICLYGTVMLVLLVFGNYDFVIDPELSTIVTEIVHYNFHNSEVVHFNRQVCHSI